MKYKNIVVNERDPYTFKVLEEALNDGWVPVEGVSSVGTSSVQVVRLQKDDFYKPGERYVDMVIVKIDEIEERTNAIAEGILTDYMRLMNAGYTPVHNTSTKVVMRKEFLADKKPLEDIEKSVEGLLEEAIEIAESNEEALNATMHPEDKAALNEAIAGTEDVLEEEYDQPVSVTQKEIDVQEATFKRATGEIISSHAVEPEIKVFGDDEEEEGEAEPYEDAYAEEDVEEGESEYDYNEDNLGCKDGCVNANVCTPNVKQALSNRGGAFCDQYNRRWSNKAKSKIKAGDLPWE